MISSVKDERVARVRELSSRAARGRLARCVLDGESLIRQAFEAGARLEFVLRAPGTGTELAGALAAAGVPVFEASEGVLRQGLRTQRPVDVLAVAEFAETTEAPYGEFAVVLDGVADPGNLGTIVRTACGLGAFDVVCTDPDTDLSSRRVLDASRGSVLAAAVRRFDTVADALDHLRGNGFEIVTTTPHGSSVQALAPLSGRPVALVVGNETGGVSEQTIARSDALVRIPMSEPVESLNVGVATGLSIAELRMRMVLASLTERARDSLPVMLSEALRAVRAAQARRLAELDHLDVVELTVLTGLVAGREPADIPDDVLARAVDSLTAKGYLADTAPTDSGRHALAVLRTPHADAAPLSMAEREQLGALLAKLGTADRDGR